MPACVALRSCVACVPALRAPPQLAEDFRPERWLTQARQADASTSTPASAGAVVAAAEVPSPAQGQGAGAAAATAVLPVIPANPDDIDTTETVAKEEVIESKDARTAAWASFCQALLGTAEFRYLK